MYEIFFFNPPQSQHPNSRPVPSGISFTLSSQYGAVIARNSAVAIVAIPALIGLRLLASRIPVP